MFRRNTLDEFIVQSQQNFSDSSGEFSGLLRHLGIAAKIVNRVVNKAGLMDILGVEGNINTSGDAVQKLDVFANDLMIEYLRNSGICAGAFSKSWKTLYLLTTSGRVHPIMWWSLILWMAPPILM